MPNPPQAHNSSKGNQLLVIEAFKDAGNS